MSADALKTGTLSWLEFVEEAKQFVHLSSCLNDGWTLRIVKEDKPGQMYLEKKTVKTGVSNYSKSTNDDTEAARMCEEHDFEVDLRCIEISRNEIVHVITYEYHIVYNLSYATPVLYFNAWTEGGRLLPLEALWEEVPLIHQPLLAEQKWNTLTQQEHPLLGRPYYQLHPCRTAELMRRVAVLTPDGDTGRICLYLVTWLSSVGHVVGLELPMEYAKLRRGS